MASQPPTEPLVIIFGSTGTGKSDLAVELALHFNGEIINSDAMQMYKGLPIITNKITVEEQRGIPHHLLGNIPLDQETWKVAEFQSEARKIIQEIRGRGKLPIVVGGTHYYVDSLLFNDRAVEVDSMNIETLGKSETVHPILDGSPEQLLEKLREVDPAMADRWHPNELRKIRRSLEIFLQTGKRASEIYAEQAKAQADLTGNWQTLLFWVYSKPEVLEERLRKRMDKMVDRGLMEETRAHHEYFRAELAADRPIDQSLGIWQSIGFKELMPYLDGLADNQDEAVVALLREESLERMKVATRQCAKYQLKWIRLKTLTSLQKYGVMHSLFLLDSSDATAWDKNVVNPAISITDKFLGGARLPEPTSISDTAREVLQDSRHKKGVPCRRMCEACNRTFVMEHEWELHMRSKPHRRAVRGVYKKQQRQEATSLAGADGAATVDSSGVETHHIQTQ